MCIKNKASVQITILKHSDLFKCSRLKNFLSEIELEYHGIHVKTEDARQ